MKLLFRREVQQETKGLLSRTTTPKFLVHARLELTPRERELADRFGLRSREIYAWLPSDLKYRNQDEMQPTSITVEKLVQGYDLRFTEFVEMANAETVIRDKSEELSRIFQAADKFQKEEVFEF